ncbi:protein MEI2-like 4 isoform X3 [Nymphaea colorata]|uniref:protein MEI2-like 4 isoform X3 n=1 Tax=Nymphaea colorata TaxID=210225 RepID=UPI00129DC420|nr:protein MEI2-like 4 isoform X3 [Nymphaea colorata]
MPSDIANRNLVNRRDFENRMEQKTASSPHVSRLGTSFFAEDVHFPVERQIGFWKNEPSSDIRGTGPNVISLMSTRNAVSSSPLESFGLIGARSLDCIEKMPYPIKEQKVKTIPERNVIGFERAAALSSASWGTSDKNFASQANFCLKPSSLFTENSKVDKIKPQHESGLFSSSLSEIFEKKMRISSRDDVFGHSIDTATAHFEEDEPFESLDEIEAQTIGNLLPDDDDLFSGVIDGTDFVSKTKNGDDMEDFDLFSSVGGMELEADDSLTCYGNNKTADLVGVISNSQQIGSNGSFAGEHPYGEHPSRTLFVRNINSNVEDAELRALFEQYGDIRALYTACKHRGFVMISYYDIRSARNAMRALQNKPLRRRKLDIHFSIPKQDNPSEKDINQGTLVVFNLDSSVSNDDLRQIFGVYGEIKEIRETPHKRHHKFIEFYDVRAADAALRALNRSDIAGKRIKLEPSRPGGARRLMQQISHDLDLEEANLLRHQGSPSNNSPPSCYGSLSNRSIPASCPENESIQGSSLSNRPTVNQFIDSAFQGLSTSSIAPPLSPPVGIAPVGNNGSQSNLGELNHSLGHMNFGFQGMPGFHPHSLPDYNIMSNSLPGGSPATVSAMTANINPRHTEGIDGRHIQRIGLNGFQGHSFDLSEGNGSCPVHGHQILWSNQSSYQPQMPSHMMWGNSPSFINGLTGRHQPQLHGFPRSQAHMVNTALPSPHHHVGSAPTVNPSLWDRRHAFAGDPGEPTGFIPGSLGSMGYSGSPGVHPLEFAASNMFSHVGGNILDPSISAGNVGLPSPQQRCHMFPNRNPMISMPPPFESSNERIRGRRSDSSNQTDNKKQYELDIDRILRGEDTRTTLMIKNIPNKYTSKMLLAAIDEHHRGTYDFIYLPIDFKNKCNVGYAFINMIDAMQIVPFYEAFNGKKWEKFNSEKVASLAYARIQGKAALIAHFQNSSLMNEDKRCRPILFHSDGPNAGDPEPFPMGVNIRTRPGKPRNSGAEEGQGSPSTSPTREEITNGATSVGGSTKDGE